MRALQIRGPHGSGQPIARVVCQPHGLILGVERCHVADGAEDLLLHTARSFREAAHDGRLDEGAAVALVAEGRQDRKSTRLNSSHLVISYAVFCLQKKYPGVADRPVSCRREATMIACGIFTFPLRVSIVKE